MAYFLAYSGQSDFERMANTNRLHSDHHLLFDRRARRAHAFCQGHTHANDAGTKVSWYPREYCHNGDCRPVATIQRAPEGLWMTTVDGVTMLVGPNDRRRASRDMRWHICVGADDTTTQKIRCVFEPPNS